MTRPASPFALPPSKKAPKVKRDTPGPPEDGRALSWIRQALGMEEAA